MFYHAPVEFPHIVWLCAPTQKQIITHNDEPSQMVAHRKTIKAHLIVIERHKRQNLFFPSLFY